MMKTIVVDDEIWMLRQFEVECAALPDIQLQGSFDNAYDALDYAKSHPVDLAFLDIKMPYVDGFTLAKSLRSINSNMLIIFVSGYDQYMCEAFQMEADYFVMKPYTSDTLKSVTTRARLLSTRLRKRVFIKTFGRFDVFVDGIPIKFSSAKAKELLAYLVDRNGAVIDSEQGFSVLWEDKCYDSTSASCYRKVLSRLQLTLNENKISDILHILQRGRAINRAAVDCDYFSYLEGSCDAIRSWNGEYMSEYSWGEYTLANLLSKRDYSK